MTIMYYALTVVLDKDIKEEDAQKIIDAVRMIKGVLEVEGNVANSATYMAQERAKKSLGRKLLEAVFPGSRIVRGDHGGDHHLD